MPIPRLLGLRFLRPYSLYSPVIHAAMVLCFFRSPNSQVLFSLCWPCPGLLPVRCLLRAGRTRTKYRVMRFRGRRRRNGSKTVTLFPVNEWRRGPGITSDVCAVGKDDKVYPSVAVSWFESFSYIISAESLAAKSSPGKFRSSDTSWIASCSDHPRHTVRTPCHSIGCGDQDQCFQLLSFRIESHCRPEHLEFPCWRQ